jgi:tetratricopeptide (TPR) repeat protein
MPATEIQKLKYREQFRSHYNAEFQSWFENLARQLHASGDFQPVRQTSGDGGLDGFVIGSQTVYQVYAPARMEELRDSDTAEKIRTDFKKAAATLNGRLKSWIFVHNHPEAKLGKLSVGAIAELKSSDPTISIQVLNIDSLWDRLSNLADEKLEALFGPRFSSEEPPTACAHNLPYDSIRDLFKGREGELAWLHSRLAKDTTTAAHPKIVITGLGGLGKTRLAVEYGWAYMSEYAHMLFVAADTMAAFQRNLAGLASNGKPLKEAIIAGMTQASDVISWLQKNSRWLLILDGVDTVDVATELERMLPSLQNGHVIITSRLDTWSPSLESLPLEVLSRETATSFLLDRTKERRRAEPDDPKRAAALVEELGGLALALEHAGAYIQMQRTSLEKYLELWREQRAAVLNWFDERVTKYPCSVAVTWYASFEQLDFPARTLLHLLSWMAPEPIPRAFIERRKVLAWLSIRPDQKAAAPVVSPGALEEAVAQLANYSLIKLENGGHDIQFHRLVQETTRLQEDAFNRDFWVFKATGFMRDLLTELSDQKKGAKRRVAAIHALAVLEKFDPNQAGDHLELINSAKVGTTILNRLFCQQHVPKVAKLAAEIFAEDGDFAQEARCWAKGAASQQQFQLIQKKWDLFLLVALRRQAAALARLADPNALAVAKQALEFARETTDFSDPEQKGVFAATLHEVSTVQRAFEDLKSAIALIDEAVSYRDGESVFLAADLRDRAEVLKDLAAQAAQAPTRQAYLDRAHVDFERATAILEKSPDADPLDLAFTQIKNGELLLESGQFQEALRFLRPAVKVIDAKFPLWHADRLRARSVLVQAEASQRVDRTQMLQEAIAAARERHGDDIRVVRTIHELSLILYPALGKVEAGAQAEKEAFEILVTLRDPFLSDLAGVYLTLRLTHRKSFDERQKSEFRTKAQQYLNSCRRSWEEFLQAMREKVRGKKAS